MSRTVMAGLDIAIAVLAGACISPQHGSLCGDERCAENETCSVVQTATSVETICVRDDDAGGDRCHSNCPVQVQQAYLKASNTYRADGFGGSVALSADGATLVVGASGESSAATGVGGDQASDAALFAGAVYVFVRSGATWVQQAYLKASNTDMFDEFGGSVALSADGATLAVGAIHERSAATGVDGDQADDSADTAGAVYVFVRSGATWVQQAYLKASNTDADDQFGFSLALSSDGSTLAVGAVRESSASTGVDGDQADNSAMQAGAVYVFTRNGTAWTQQAYLKASNTDAGDQFGTSVALSGDGSTLAVGTPWESSAATGAGGDQTDNSATFAGAVYVFARSSATWTQQTYLKASNTQMDSFGLSVALSGDAATLAVGAFNEASAATGIGGAQTDNSAPSAGAAYVFVRNDATWIQQAYVKASNTHARDLFGYCVALSADGATLAVGARSESSAATGVDGDQTDRSAPSAGAAYLFTRSGAVWAQKAYLKASNTDRTDSFGMSLAVSGDGATVTAGAPLEASAATGVGGDQADNTALAAGAAYVFY